MALDDPATTVRLAALAKMTRDLAQSRTPAETLRAIRRGMSETYGPITSILLSTRGLPAGEYRVLELRVHGVPGDEDADPWAHGVVPIHRGGLISQIIQWPEPTMLQGADWSGDPNFHDSLAGYDSVLAVPFTGDHLPMSWIILLRRSPPHFTAEDLEQMVLRITLIAFLLDSQALTQELAKAHDLIDKEVRRVGQIQRNLLPDPLPQIPGLEIATSYETFGEAGGDLYDFVLLDGPTPQRWAIFIADASGHGPSAAVVIAIVQALLHSCPPGVTSPAALLQHLNEHLCRRPIESSFVTAFLGVYDPSTHRLEFACAGHPPPLLLRAAASAATHLDSASGLPLGIDQDHAYPQACIELNPGDTLLLYTDGVDEARDADDKMFGVEGIETVARGFSGTPQQLVAVIRHAITVHEKGRRATDDQTLVAVHCPGVGCTESHETRKRLTT